MVLSANVAHLPGLFHRELRHAVRGDAMGIENMRFLQMVRPLPDRLEDWPKDSREAMDGRVPGSQRYRCKCLGPDGRCTIYNRRPYVCKNHQPCAEDCGGCSNLTDGVCVPPGENHV
jgi:Fe-S-cluster containining protein